MEFVLTKTNAEKLEKIFFDRFTKLRNDCAEKRLSSFALKDTWIDFVSSLDGVEHVRKFSNLASEIDYLLEIINQNLPFDKFILHDLGMKMWESPSFIIVERDFAEKILVLGFLP